jgi:hypothetical protein
VLFENIVRDQIEPVITSHYEKYFHSGLVDMAGFDRSNYRFLSNLVARWNKPVPKFLDRTWFSVK